MKKIKTLEGLYNFIIKEGNEFEQLCNEDNNCECIKNQVYEDCDWEEFLEGLNVEIDRTDNIVVMTNGKTTIEVECRDFPNRHDDDLPDETIFFMDTMKLV